MNIYEQIAELNCVQDYILNSIKESKRHKEPVNINRITENCFMHPLFGQEIKRMLQAGLDNESNFNALYNAIKSKIDE